MNIPVKQEHIEQGKMCSDDCCPISLALNESTNHKWLVDEHQLINITDKRIYDTPPIVKYFIRKFDNQIKGKKDNIYVGLKDLTPFVFTLPNREYSRYYFSDKKRFDGRQLVKKWGLV